MTTIQLSAPYQEWLNSPLVLLTLTLAAYELGALVYRWTREFPLFHPGLLGAVLIAGLLRLADIDYRTYVDGTQILRWLLGVATVAMAVPLYSNLSLMRQLALPIGVTVVLGAAVGATSVVGIAWLMGCDPEILRSLAPKSITTPIALGVSREIGGIVELTTGAVMITAATGVTLAPLLFKWLRIDDARVRGVALGVAAHALGAARAYETNVVTGAFASLALCLTGVVTAIGIPLLIRWF